MEVVFALLGPHIDDKPLHSAQTNRSTNSGIRTSGRFHCQLK
ncbi:hypothetical protein T11_6206 [Trichinella zimbabwensis]|uniref:Uncharacterized protein n=1 Tax=Trichinella zimbabwensis TaxID=268475 RepID=A0A0V1GCR3_9BILA|nr:hypothetical protein T11_6206 [Trichinella zimbabwensis]